MELIGISLLFGLICLDQKYALQFGISQPLITSMLLGVLTGEFIPSMYFGAVIQLFWLGNLPIGASKIPDGNIASVIGAYIYLHFSHQAPFAHGFLLFVAVFMTVIFSFFGSEMDIGLRKRNVMFLDWGLRDSHGDKKIRVGKYIISALSFNFVANALMIFIGCVIGLKLVDLLKDVSAILAPANWRFVDIAVIGTGVGMVMAVYKDKKTHRIIGLIAVSIILILKVAHYV